jgi:hypothetical protein
MLFDVAGLGRMALGSRQRQAAVRRNPPSQTPVRHGFTLLASDRIGVVALCRCRRRGVGTSTVERAEKAYATEHLAEMGFRYSRYDDEE